MIKILKIFLTTSTGRDTLVVLATTFLNILIGGLFFVFAPRILGPDNYGIFSTIISTSVMVLTLANFGIDTGMLRFANKSETQFKEVTSLALKIYLVLAAVITVLGFFLAPLIQTLLKLSEITGLLRIAFAGSAFLLLSNFFIAALQAKGEFFKASIVNISSNLVRLIVLLVALKFFELNIIMLTLLFFTAPIVSVVVGSHLFPPKFEKKTQLKIHDFFKFNTPIAFALIISSIPFDNYLLLNMAGANQTGIYSAPFKILTFAYMFGGNFTRVLATRFTSFDNSVKVIAYSKKAAPIAVLLSIATLVTIPLAPSIINILFGADFLGSIIVYQSLAVGFAIFFLSTIPSSIIIYYLGRSNVSLLITVFKYIILTLGMLVLIPGSGALGAALSFTLAEAMSLIFMSFYCAFKIKNGNSSQA